MRVIIAGFRNRRPLVRAADLQTSLCFYLFFLKSKVMKRPSKRDKGPIGSCVCWFGSNVLQCRLYLKALKVTFSL